MNDVITIEGNQVRVTTPEGKTLTMPLEKFVDALAPSRIDTGGLVFPDGVKAAFAQGPVTILVYEAPPRVYSLRWLANDSPVRFGRGAKYRNVGLAFPYLVLLAVFAAGPHGQPLLTQRNECYFRTAPLKGVDDELFYPALLNCSKIVADDGRAMSWLCTQHLNFAALARETNLHRRLYASFEALRHCLLETGFNYSSEHHEGTSWFSESVGIDPRISTVEKWEEATSQDRLFVLDVPWLPTGRTLGQTVDALFHLVGATRRKMDSAEALARIVLNQERPGRRLPHLAEALLDQL